MEVVDAEMVQEGELVPSVGSPRVTDLQRSGRPPRIALVHGDESKVAAVGL